MADRRMVHRNISDSKRLRKIGLECALIWTWAIPWLDDDGRTDADPNTFRGRVVPKWPWTDDDMAGFLITMHNKKAIRLYTAPELMQGDELLLHAQWFKFKDFQTLRDDRPFIGASPQPRIWLPMSIDDSAWDREEGTWSKSLWETVGKPPVNEGSNEGTNEGIAQDAAAFPSGILPATAEGRKAIRDRLNSLKKGNRVRPTKKKGPKS